MARFGTDGWEDQLAAGRPPSRWRGAYLGSIGLIVLGVVMIPVTVVWQASRLFGPARGAPLVRAPGEVTTPLDLPGEYAVWNEKRSIVNGWLQSTPEVGTPAEFTIGITDEGGNALAFDTTKRGMVNLKPIERGLLGRFKVERPGRYTIKVATSGTGGSLLSVTPAPEADEAIMGVVILFVVLLALGLIGAGGVLLIVTIVRHVRAARRVRLLGR